MTAPHAIESEGAPPLTWASCLASSFCFCRLRNSSLQREGCTCSTRTWMRFLSILWPTWHCTPLLSGLALTLLLPPLEPSKHG